MPTPKATPKATPTESLPAEFLAEIRSLAISSRTSWLPLGRKVLAAQKAYPWLTAKGLADSLKEKYGKEVAYVTDSSLSKASTVALAFSSVSDVDLARRTLSFWYAAYKSFVQHGQMGADAAAAGLLADRPTLKIPKAGKANRAVTLPTALVDRLHKARGKTPLAEFLASLLKA